MGPRKCRDSLWAIAALVLLVGCGPPAKAKVEVPKTIRWWHINSDLPSQQVLGDIAREFEASHPWVTVKVVMLQNMEFKPKLQLEFAADDPPDLFHSWGGGNLAEQARAGYLKDITSWVKGDHWQSRIDPVALGLYSDGGKVYGFPQDLGAVGFWYNSALLQKVGYTEFPRDWDGFLKLCQALKKAGTVPLSLGISDRWTVMYYWVYLALRIGGPDLFTDILEGKRGFDDPALVEAGTRMRALFEGGFLQPTALGDDFNGQSRVMGDGDAAMQLMGQWALAVQAQASEKKEALAPVMRFAPFPAVKGGKGGIQDAMGGGNGFVVGKNAPDEAVELLEYFTRAENLRRYFKVFPAIPTVDAVPVDAPGLGQVKSYLTGIAHFCLYPDQMFPLEVGNLLNETSAKVILGELTPRQGGDQLQAAWKAAKSGGR